MHHADSGAIYRAATVARLGRDGESGAWTADSVLSDAERVTLVRRGATFEVFLGDLALGRELYEPAVTALVSLVAKMPTVRAWVNVKMRESANEGPIVVDGRDMGTAVFPEAQLKIFLIAHVRERARRRLLQRLGRPPMDAEITGEAEALRQRDAKDAAQTQQAVDAVVIDTTHLTQEDQVDRIVELAHAAGAPMVGGR